MKKIVSLIVIAICAVFPVNAQDPLNEFVKEMNKACPIVMDETLTMSGVSIDNKDLTFEFKVAPSDFKDLQDNKELFKSMMCDQFREMAKDDGLNALFGLIILSNRGIKMVFRESNSTRSMTLRLNTQEVGDLL